MGLIVIVSIADYGYVLQSGKVVSSGKADELSDHTMVREAYLGNASSVVNHDFGKQNTTDANDD